MSDLVDWLWLEDRLQPFLARFCDQMARETNAVWHTFFDNSEAYPFAARAWFDLISPSGDVDPNGMELVAIIVSAWSDIDAQLLVLSAAIDSRPRRKIIEGLKLQLPMVKCPSEYKGRIEAWELEVERFISEHRTAIARDLANRKRL